MKAVFVWIALCMATQALWSEVVRAGFVVQVNGTWTEGNPPQQLKPGQMLVVGEKLSAPSPCRLNDKILLAYLDDSSKTVTVSCNAVQSPYVVRAVGKKDPWLISFHKAFVAFLDNELVEVKYAAGRDARGPQEAVITGSNLAPALLTLGAGDYPFQIKAPGAKQVLASGVLTWNPPNVFMDKPVELPLGLYLLLMKKTDGEPCGDPAMLLVVKPEEMPRYQTAYQGWLAHTGSGNSDSDGSARVLSAALLASLYKNPDMVKNHP